MLKILLGHFVVHFWGTFFGKVPVVGKKTDRAICCPFESIFYEAGKLLGVPVHLSAVKLERIEAVPLPRHDF